MSNYKIYTATLGKFDNSNIEQIYVVGGRTIKPLKFDFIRTIDCLLDDQNDNVIDLESGEEFHVLKRNEGRIDYSEKDIIFSGQVNAVRLEEKDYTKTSLIFQMWQQKRADYIYNKHLEKLTFNDKNPNKKIKSKKIGKEF